MNKVDKKIFEMAKNERIEVPKTYEEKENFGWITRKPGWGKT